MLVNWYEGAKMQIPRRHFDVTIMETADFLTGLDFTKLLTNIVKKNIYRF